MADVTDAQVTEAAELRAGLERLHVSVTEKRTAAQAYIPDHRDRVLAKLDQELSEKLEAADHQAAALRTKLAEAQAAQDHERALRSARFHPEAALDAQASVAFQGRLARATELELVSWAEDAKRGTNPALGRLVVEEAQHRGVKPDRLEQIRQIVARIPLANPAQRERVEKLEAELVEVEQISRELRGEARSYTPEQLGQMSFEEYKRARRQQQGQTEAEREPLPEYSPEQLGNLSMAEYRRVRAAQQQRGRS